MSFLSPLSSEASSELEAGLSTVLVVESSERYRARIASLLRISGYRAIVAPDGACAMTLLSRIRPVLIVSDLRLLQADAASLLAYCRVEHAAVPILILADEVPDTPPDIEAGTAGFLLKPIDPGRFCAAVGRVIARAAMRSIASSDCLQRHDAEPGAT